MYKRQLPLSLQLLQRCQQMLVDWLHNGLHHQEQRACREAEALAADLQRCGFARLAKLAAQIPTRLRGADPEELVKTLTAFVLLRDRLEQECLLMPSAF